MAEEAQRLQGEVDEVTSFYKEVSGLEDRVKRVDIGERQAALVLEALYAHVKEVASVQNEAAAKIQAIQRGKTTRAELAAKAPPAEKEAAAEEGKPKSKPPSRRASKDGGSKK